MPNLSLKQALAGVLSLALAGPMAPLPSLAQSVDPDKPSDGAVSPAACRVFGFTLPEQRTADYARGATQQFARGAAPAYVPGMQPPPPPPPPPPPSAPPPPVMPAIVSAPTADAAAGLNEVVVSGSRIRPAPPPGMIAPPRPADTERYPDATPNPVRRVADEPVSTFSIDVDTASYANVRR
ncbi:MAG: VWA domain-containing protein, partial [Brevundimonas sp.]